MTKTQEFDYYYDEGSDDFQFIRIPLQLITDPRFRGLSSEAKLLYSLLLDRMRPIRPERLVGRAAPSFRLLYRQGNPGNFLLQQE